MTANSPVLTLKQAMAYLKRGRSWMLGHADAIGVIRDGGTLRFMRADLDAWLARHRTQQAPLRTVKPTPPVSQRRGGISVLTGKPFEVAR